MGPENQTNKAEAKYSDYLEKIKEEKYNLKIIRGTIKTAEQMIADENAALSGGNPKTVGLLKGRIRELKREKELVLSKIVELSLWEKKLGQAFEDCEPRHMDQ